MHATAITACTPEEVGYDASRIDVLHNHFQKLMDQKKILAASYCVSRYGKTFMQGAIGPLTYKTDETQPLLSSTIHPIASITKAITAVAIAKLVEDGLLRYDMPVGSFLPPFNIAPFNKIDIYSLLTHTSGMFADCAEQDNPYHKSYWDFVHHCFENHKPESGEPDWIKASLSCGVSKKIGEEWQYCSFGFCLLGEIIKKATGINAEDYIEEQLLRPLGMTDTFFKLSPEAAKRIIIRNEEQEQRLNHYITGVTREQSPVEKLWDLVPKTGGGLFSTTADLMRFANMLLGMGTLEGTRILGRKTVEKITTRSLYGVPNYCWGSNEKDRGYSYGLDMRQGPAFLYSPTTYYHEGAGACSMIIDPTEQLAAVWFVPFADDSWHAEALYNVTNIIWSGLLP